MTVSGPRTADVRVLLEAATRLFRVTLLKCLPFAMVAALLVQLPNIYWVATGHTLSGTLPSDNTYLSLYLMGSMAGLFVFAAMMWRQRACAGGADARVSADLAAAARRFPALLGASVLAQLSVAVGVLCFVAPGVILLVCYVVWLPVVLFDRAGPLDTLVRCVKLIWPLWWKIFAAIVIAFLVVVVCVLAIAAVINVVAALLVGEGPAFSAVMTAGIIAICAAGLVFLSALALVIHSAASSSA